MKFAARPPLERVVRRAWGQAALMFFYSAIAFWAAAIFQTIVAKMPSAFSTVIGGVLILYLHHPQAIFYFPLPVMRCRMGSSKKRLVSVCKHLCFEISDAKGGETK